MQELISFAAALIALRLAGLIASRWRARRAPELLAWSLALAAYAVACAALAWGAAAGWDGRAFRLYYLFGGLLTAPLLGAGSLLRLRVPLVAAATCVYVGLACGVAIASPLHGHVAGHAVPSAQHLLPFVPARLLALLGNSIGTAAVVVVALVTVRRRPRGNTLIVAGVACAGLGGAVAFSAGAKAVFLALGAVLLYLGFIQPSRRPLPVR